MKPVMLLVALACCLPGTATATEPFDFDADGDLDLIDFGQFQICFSGSLPFAPGCEPGDGDGDGDVDLIDFGQFQIAFTGPLCPPRWSAETFCHPAVNGTIYAMATWNDGTGDALYVGGAFTIAGCDHAVSIAKWNGSTWSPLGTGMGGTNPYVYALAVLNDGTGEALYAGGNFSTAGGIPAGRVAKWNGSDWSAVGTLPDSPLNIVYALAVYDDGRGDALYAGGFFSFNRWDGSAWTPMTGGIEGSIAIIYALTVFNDGTGPSLYAGGLFGPPGGMIAHNIIEWDGSIWSPLGSGTNSTVRALTVFNDGGGDALYAGGQFNMAGGVPVNHVARWNGSQWSGVGAGTNGTVRALTALDDGTGQVLYAGGEFTTGTTSSGHIASWDGSTWSGLGSGVDGLFEPWIYCLAAFDDGSGTALHAAGAFSFAGGQAVNRIAKWQDAGWSSLDTPMDGLLMTANALAVSPLAADPNGSALYAAGVFTAPGPASASRIARWDGSTWSPLGSGIPATAWSLAFFDDGTGPALYAGGSFTTAGGVSANHIAKWDGSSWSPLGTGVMGGPSPSVLGLAVFNDGTSSTLIAGGNFNTAGAVSANRIAKWDGSTWSRLGSGMNDTVWALTISVDGIGESLYAGGAFTTAGGMTANRIAKWDGAAWAPLGAGMNNTVWTLYGFNQPGSGGDGPELYAGGDFTMAGGAAANRIARWNGTTWSPLGAGMNDRVLALTRFDDIGTASAPGVLYAAGRFTTAGGMAANAIATWDGATWSPLDIGLDGEVRALAVFPGGGDGGVGFDLAEPALFAGGAFTTAGGTPSAHVAQWSRPAAPCPQ